ncbi:MAG: Dabb family protein [Microthrixaceae bacterium]
MIRHIAVFRWHEGTTPDQVAAVAAGLDGLPGVAPSIRTYAHGADLRLGEGRWDYVVIAEFDDVEGYHAYVDHPAHAAVLSERIAPLAADRAHVQIVC